MNEKNRGEIYNNSFFAMGTRCDVVFTAAPQEQAERTFLRVKNEIVRLEKLLSRFIHESPVSRINNTPKKKWIEVPGELWDYITLCHDFYQLSNGAFDITASPVVRLWKKMETPAEQDIDEARSRSGFDKVEFDFENHKIRFLCDGVEFDFGAIGKGIALDTVFPVLKSAGIRNGIVSFGESSVLALGVHPSGKKWPLGIRNPFNPKEFIHVFEAADETVTTSGTILNSDDGGVIFRNHIISPETGRPVLQRKNVSVKSLSAVTGEFLSTSLMILPEADGISVTGRMKNLEILEVEFSQENDYISKLTLL